MVEIEVIEKDIPQRWYDAINDSPCIGMDIETSGLDKQFDKIACIQCYVPNEGSFLLRNMDHVPYKLLGVLENRKIKKIFHHAPFDLAFIMRDYSVQPRNIVCTKIMMKLVDSEVSFYFDTHYSLKTLVYYHFGVILDKSIATTNWFGHLSSEQLEYAMRDVIYLPELYTILSKELLRKKKMSLAQEAFQFLPMKVAIELQTGIGDIYGYKAYQTTP